MAQIIDLAHSRRILRPRARRRRRPIESPVERYKRADLNWRLNPTPGTAAERVKALEAVAEARAKPSVAGRPHRRPDDQP